MADASILQFTQVPTLSQRDRTTREEFIVWDQKNLVILWADGHRSCFSWLELRTTCPCEACQQSRLIVTPERDAA